jgi:hypothetical protein
MLPPISRQTMPPGADAAATLNLVATSANLFYHLRSLDGHAARTIAVAPIPESGIGEATNDRLRAAASRETSARPHSIVACARASSRAISSLLSPSGSRRSVQAAFSTWGAFSLRPSPAADP